MLRGPIPSNSTAGDVTRAACNVTSHLTRHTPSISRRVFARGMQRNGAPQKKENKKRAQGKPGAHGTRGPVRHYAYGEKETPQVQTGHRLPCAMVLTAYFALSPVIGLMLPPSPVIKGLLPFAGSTPLAERQDHTTWPSASHRHRHFDRPMSKPE